MREHDLLGLVSLEENEISGLPVHTKKWPCEDTMGRQLPASQGERPREK